MYMLTDEQELGFDPRRGAAMAPASLAAGCGADVLDMLNWLSTSVLERESAGEFHTQEKFFFNYRGQ